MQNIPNLSYDSSGSFNASFVRLDPPSANTPQSQKRITSIDKSLSKHHNKSDSTSSLLPQDSISRSQSSSYSKDSIIYPRSTTKINNPERIRHLHENTVYKDEKSFQEQLDRLKMQSSRKFRNKWEEILDKYSKIDDDVESDEIDLVTGKITRDNGHIRSLRSQGQQRDGLGRILDGDIWAVDYDWEKEQRLREKKQKEHKSELKSRLKEMQLFHNVSSKETVDEIPRIKRGILEDNLLLNPSPTKKSKMSSPLRGDSVFDTSPNKDVPTFSDDDSPVKRSRPKKSRKDILESPTKPHRSNNFKIKSIELEEPLAESSTIVHESRNQSSDEFEEEFSIITDQFIPPSAPTIYHCAFEKCYYCTGNKLLYQNHLLEKHTEELSIVGYPVSSDKKTIIVSAESEKKIIEQFPIVYSIPPLALSKDGKPLFCNTRMHGGRSCQKFFLSSGDLQKHQASPSSCSYKKQVMVCPLLGCGYITDGGYLEWRDHFINEGHDLDPEKFSENQAKPIVDSKISGTVDHKISSVTSETLLDRYNLNQALWRHGNTAPENIDELFSDDSGIESDLQDSESEDDIVHDKPSQQDVSAEPESESSQSDIFKNGLGKEIFTSSSSSVPTSRSEPLTEEYHFERIKRKISIGVPSFSKQTSTDFNVKFDDSNGYESIEELFES